MKFNHSIVWLRRDLRLHDHTALAHAIENSRTVSLIFIFDPSIIKNLPPTDRRLTFIWESLVDIDKQLRLSGGAAVHKFHALPEKVLPELFQTCSIDALFFNHDYEPVAMQRDTAIDRLGREAGVHVQSFKDQVVFEKNEILKDDRTPYKVFTAYKNKWLKEYETLLPENVRPAVNNLTKIVSLNTNFPKVNGLENIKFHRQENFIKGGESEAQKTWKQFSISFLNDYDRLRDLPGEDQTSRLSPFLRFGNISVRQLLLEIKNYSSSGSKIYMSELIWREFFMMILYHFPHVVQQSFNKPFDKVRWLNNEKWFEAWCKGRTGFPIVDAGMRQLSETGWMHNRVRMITASFLVKHLHIDWRWGEKYFAEKLLDYELSSNNGNWQWAAGTGVDAAPYFRIFNPITQSKKFDPEGVYIRRWIPELRELSAKLIHNPSGINQYPSPIIDLDKERKVCLDLYNLRS
ncbi:DNA photolyase family protein [bacterium]|nr:DNA photolyase family protein [bacterium]